MAFIWRFVLFKRRAKWRILLEGGAMKVKTIVSIMERYNTLQSRLYYDKLDLENYRTLEPDEIKMKTALKKVKYDYEELGKFLDEEV